MTRRMGAFLLLGSLAVLPVTRSAEAHGELRGAGFSAPKNNPPPNAAPKAPTLTCTLLTTEAPRGGRLEVAGQGFGKAPLVRIGGRVARMIERTETLLAVQIHIDSDGGVVSVKAGALEAQCGTLTIIGKN